MITISNLYLGHVGFNSDFESQNFWTKAQVFWEGGPIPVTLGPAQIPHGLVADFKR
jgi:hypothetical protein